MNIVLKGFWVSRRRILGAIAGLVSMPSFSSVQTEKDAELIRLGRRFHDLLRDLDHQGWAVGEAESALARVEVAILNIEATTMEGLYVKARAACWALLGDLNCTTETTTDRRMGVSIIRDLIRFYEPSLERAEALTRLVDEVTTAPSPGLECMNGIEI